MGIRNRMTREALAKVDAEEFEAFLDDVADTSLREACESRVWTQSAVLNWISSDEGRSGAYSRALQVRAELAVHEGREIVDKATPEDVGVAKLRSGYRQFEASKWNRARYGDGDGKSAGGITVIVQRGGTEPPAVGYSGDGKTLTIGEI